MSRCTEIVLKNLLSRSKNPNTQIRATDYDLQRNSLLGISVSLYTEIVLKNVLSGPKNLQVHSNSRGSYLLSIAVCRCPPKQSSKHTQRVEESPGTVKIMRKYSPGHERIAVRRNSPQKRAQWVEKPPGTLKFTKKLSPGHQRVAVHLNSPQNILSGSKKPQVQSKLRGSYLLGIRVSPYTEIVL